MKITQINATCGVGSTGKICVEISRLLTEQNTENYILYSNKTNGYPLGISCADRWYLRLQAMKSRILGNYGFNSRRATKKMIQQLTQIQPDIVHLHNIHGHDCHLEMLFSYFRKNGVKLIWTFHDCWAFTGYCPHFTMARCDQWRTACQKCVQWREYSWLFDRSRWAFKQKKELFRGLDLTIVTPSQWLADLVKSSFLKEYPVKVIHNGIDLDVFKPTNSRFRGKYGLSDQKILLGVAFGWGKGKGLDVFIDLANRLDDSYRIVLVGTDPEVDKQLPGNIISIHRTQNQTELAQIYTAADVLVNPTREDNYPTVNMEAIACGTPVITFKTGGSPEMIDGSCGLAVPCDDTDALERAIVRVCTEQPFSKEQCLQKARSFDMQKKYKEYLQLYETINAD